MSERNERGSIFYATAGECHMKDCACDECKWTRTCAAIMARDIAAMKPTVLINDDCGRDIGLCLPTCIVIFCWMIVAAVSAIFFGWHL